MLDFLYLRPKIGIFGLEKDELVCDFVVKCCEGNLSFFFFKAEGACLDLNVDKYHDVNEHLFA